jgi:hypothetical protein
MLDVTMSGIRDRALLALGFAGAFRRSELVALQVSDRGWVTGRLSDRHSEQQDRPDGRGD